MSRTKGAGNKKHRFRVDVSYRNGEAESLYFPTKREALELHRRIEKEYDENIRRSELHKLKGDLK